MNTEKEFKSFKRAAMKYEKNSPIRFQWYGYTEEEMDLHYEALTDLIPSFVRSVLEVGCGSGRLAEILLKKRNVEYHGFDIVPENIEAAIDRKIGGAYFYVGNYWDELNKIKDCEFVISCGTLFSTTDPKYVSLLFDLLNSVSKKGFIVMALRFTTKGISSKILNDKMLMAIESSVGLRKYYYKGKRDFLNQPLIRRNHPFYIWRDDITAIKPEIPDFLISERRGILF